MSECVFCGERRMLTGKSCLRCDVLYGNAAPAEEKTSMEAPCNACTFLFPIVVAACPLCGEPRSPAGHGDEWACSSCTLINDVSETTCVACGVPRVAAAAGGGGGGGPAAPPSPPPGWVCAECTFINAAPTAVVCGLCSSARVGVPGWRCKLCSLVNALNLYNCNACEEPRYAEPHPPAAPAAEAALPSGAPQPPLRLSLGGDGGAGAVAAAEAASPPALGTPIPPRLPAPPEGVADAALAVADVESLPFVRQLGHSSIRASRCVATHAQVAAYAAALSEEAFALEAGILASNEAWAKKPGSGGGNPGAALAAVNKELRFLAANTSNSVWPSSICLRADEGNVLCMKALITGAPHTPYANGVFLFDLALPANYPKSPPHVLIVSRGGGGIRWNPNLYSCGKVCLSLLGTWQGPGWDPSKSTIYQVLQSIQTQVLNKFPLENEPSLEAVGAEGPRGHLLRNARFNLEVRLHTLRHGITAFIRAPPRFFEAAVLAHVSHKKRELAAQAVLWAEEALLFARYQLEVCCPPQPRRHPLFAHIKGCGDSCTASHPSPSDSVCLVCGRGWGQHGGHTCQGGGRGSWALPGQEAALTALLPPVCGASCSLSHSDDGNCLKCGRGWGPHSGHTCKEGGRGAWRSLKSSHPTVGVEEQMLRLPAQQVGSAPAASGRASSIEELASDLALLRVSAAALGAPPPPNHGGGGGGGPPGAAPNRGGGGGGGGATLASPEEQRKRIASGKVSLFWVAVATLEASRELIAALKGVPDPEPSKNDAA